MQSEGVVSQEERNRVHRLVCTFLPPSFDRDFITDTIILHSWEAGVESVSRSYVRHKCISEWRHQKREERRNEEMVHVLYILRTEPPKASTPIELKTTVEKAVKALSPIERRIIWLRFYAGKTLEETSAETGLKRETVQQLLKNSLYKMRVELT